MPANCGSLRSGCLKIWQEAVSCKETERGKVEGERGEQRKAEGKEERVDQNPSEEVWECGGVGEGGRRTKGEELRVKGEGSSRTEEEGGGWERKGREGGTHPSCSGDRWL